MSQSFKLYRLQQVDTQIDQKKNRIEQIVVALANNAELQEAEQHAQATSQTLQAARRELKQAEFNTQTQKNKITQNENELFGGKVRNPKVLQDLQNEAEALKRYLEVLEERQLESMFALEEAEAQHQANETAVEQIKARLIETHAALRGEKHKLEEELERLAGERLAAAQNLEPDELETYTRLRNAKRGIAVAKVTESACSACGAELSSSLLQAARSPSQLVRCDTCGRILYAL